MSDVVKLFKKTKGKPSLPQIKKAEKGERAEGLRDALKRGKGDAAKGGKALGYKHKGLPEAEALEKKALSPKKKKK